MTLIDRILKLEYPQATFLQIHIVIFFYTELIFNQHCLKKWVKVETGYQYSNAISNPEAQGLIKNQLI